MKILTVPGSLSGSRFPKISLKPVHSLPAMPFLAAEARKLTSAEVRQCFLQLAGEHGDSFPTRRLFRRFLERRLESESQEAEAFARNIPLAELEEENRRNTKRRLVPQCIS
jgi:hypothetical protein